MTPDDPTPTPPAPTPALPQESAATRDDLDDPQFCGLPPWPRPPSGESRVLPGPVWNALTNAATKIEDVALRQRFLVEAEKCLAPLWPRPALVDAVKRLYLAGRWECQSLSVAEQVRLWEQVRDAAGIPAGSATSAGVAGPVPVTADARELAKELDRIWRQSDAYAENHEIRIVRIAADLAPVLAALAEARTFQRNNYQGMQAALARAEAAERERDQLRAEVERLTGVVEARIQEIKHGWSEQLRLRAQLADARQAVAAAQAACHTYAVPVINGDLVGAINQLGLDRQKLMADKERLDTLRRLMGYTQDGSNQTVKLFEDDATRDFFIMAGRRTYMGGELRAAIDAARREGGAT